MVLRTPISLARGRPGCGEIHEVDARQHNNKTGNNRKEVYILNVTIWLKFIGQLRMQVNIRHRYSNKFDVPALFVELIKRNVQELL